MLGQTGLAAGIAVVKGRAFVISGIQSIAAGATECLIGRKRDSITDTLMAPNFG